MASRNVEKTRLRVEKRIEEGSYYEAHQQLRVLSQRYVKSEDYDAAIRILDSGSRSLLKAGQSGSGADLCLLLLDVYKTAKVAPSPQSKSRIFELIAMIPADEPSRKRVINESVAWTSKLGEYPAGDPELHHFVGNLFAQEGEVYEAERHLLLGTKESANVFAHLLYAWYQQDDAHTAPAYISRAVLPYIILGKLQEASRSLDTFTQKLVQNSPGLSTQEVQSATASLRVFPSLPLLNFLAVILLAVPRGGADLLRSLQAHYAANLKDVPAWNDALEQIGETYFGIPIRRSQNIFDMMGSLFEGSSTRQQRPREIGSDSTLD